eukprot:COSAG02_NODE_56983_length_282_cov_1.415301_1_plen_53_part_01
MYGRSAEESYLQAHADTYTAESYIRATTDKSESWLKSISASKCARHDGQIIYC